MDVGVVPVWSVAKGVPLRRRDPERFTQERSNLRSNDIAINSKAAPKQMAGSWLDAFRSTYMPWNEPNWPAGRQAGSSGRDRIQTQMLLELDVIPEHVLRGWQSIVDLLVDISGARVGLFMRRVDDEIAVLISSNTANNPYRMGDSEQMANSGLYCETVIKTQARLLIPNALKDKEWDHNPDLKFGLISYLGLPIRLPNGEVFGTLCFLDDKENAYSVEIESLMEKMRNLFESHLSLIFMAFVDGLTAIANRRRFDEALLAEWRQSQRVGAPLALLMIDIDAFKRYNDHYGHQAGDVCLQTVARTLKNEGMLCTHDLVARFGGEEFACLLPGCGREDAIHKAERLRAAVEALAIPHSSAKVADCVTVSIGVASLQADGATTAQTLIQQADKALYASKINGRNQVTFGCS